MIDFPYELIRSKRKSISIEISREAKIIVRAPLKMRKENVELFLLMKSKWIEEHLKNMENRIKDDKKPLSNEEIINLKKLANKEIPIRVEYYAKLMGVDYEKIAIRSQKTRFGSCSNNKNLNFNLAIMLMPSEIMDYVIVHELAHIKEMNHSKSFWLEVEKIIPNYKECRAYLKENGIKYINQIKEKELN